VTSRPEQLANLVTSSATPSGGVLDLLGTIERVQTTREPDNRWLRPPRLQSESSRPIGAVVVSVLWFCRTRV
jgi:hypothetical protein